jgi:hypothetical protein
MAAGAGTARAPAAASVGDDAVAVAGRAALHQRPRRGGRRGPRPGVRRGERRAGRAGLAGEQVPAGFGLTVNAARGGLFLLGDSLAEAVGVALARPGGPAG